MKRIVLQIVIVVVFPFLGYAQHEFSVYGGGGLSNLKYTSAAGNQQSGFGAQLGLGYRFFFVPELGVGTGIEIALYSAKFNADNINVSYRTTDMEGAPFDFRSSVSGYEERQKAYFLKIPLLLQYQRKIDKTHLYYIAGGFKVGIPLNATYNNTADVLNNSGFYPKEIYEYTTQQFMGFGTFHDRTSHSDLEFQTTYFLSLEAGIKFKIGGALYIGAYLDYALNSVVKNPSLPFVEYHASNPAAFALNSIANSKYARNGATVSFTDVIRPVAAGVKVIIAFWNK